MVANGSRQAEVRRFFIFILFFGVLFLGDEKAGLALVLGDLARGCVGIGCCVISQELLIFQEDPSRRDDLFFMSGETYEK